MRRATETGLVAALCTVLSAPPVLGQAVEGGHRITVSATREVTPAPDRARVSLAIERIASTAEQAAREVGEASQQVIKAVRRQVEKEASVATKRYGLDPQYAPPPKGSYRGERKIVGYRGYNEVEVVTANLDGLGALIDAAVGAGANRIAGLLLEVADAAPYQREALEKATSEAMLQARTIAQALGVKLGPVAEATTEPREFPAPRPVLATSMARAVAETPVLPGTVTIRAWVRLSYEIIQ